jgi:hypothetical protein
MEVHVQSQQSEWSCMCISSIDKVSVSTIFQLDFETDLTCGIFCFSSYCGSIINKKEIGFSHFTNHHL